MRKHKDSRKKQKLFSVRTKLSYYKVFRVKFIDYRYGKKSNI